ncbi:MAG TPA: glutamyl-tRNA reductase [bacterium]|nr:glutamyl-tRNA reductase [bacterium]
MKFQVFGLNHATAPVSIREKYALAPDAVKAFLRDLKALAPEAAFLSTCNRVEFYFLAEPAAEVTALIRKKLQAYHRLSPAEARKYFYRHEDLEAFRHLFRVAASLDSMVVGESQILGQVKEAFRFSVEAGMAGSTLTGIFNRAFSAAKTVRSQTEIARMPVSVSSVAVSLAGKIFGDLAQKKVLLLGAGEMSELTAKYLAGEGVADFWVANRTLEKAKALAAKLKGQGLSLDQGIAQMGEADIVLTSLQVERALVGAPDVEAAMRSRKGKPLFIIDLGVPRNVDAEAGRQAQVYLYNIDDLSAVAQSNQQERQKAMAAADEILSREIDGLCSWLNNLELVPTIVRLKERFESVRQEEWDDFSKRLAHLDEKDRALVERLSRDLAAHLLHAPLVTLKNLPDARERFEYAKMLNDLFGLWKGPEE